MALCFNRLQSRNCCFDQNNDNSHGLQSHLLHGRNNTTRKKGAIYQQGSAGQLFCFTVDLVANTKLPTPWAARTIWGIERNLMQQRTRRTNKIENYGRSDRSLIFADVPEMTENGENMEEKLPRKSIFGPCFAPVQRGLFSIWCSIFSPFAVFGRVFHAIQAQRGSQLSSFDCENRLLVKRLLDSVCALFKLQKHVVAVPKVSWTEPFFAPGSEKKT